MARPKRNNTVYVGGLVSPQNRQWVEQRVLDTMVAQRRRVTISEVLDTCLTYCRLHMPAPTEQE